MELIELKVVARRQLTPNAVSLEFEALNKDLQYEPGQFLTISFDTPFGEKKRSYSFSSSPVCKERPTISVKEMENGEFSRLLVRNTPEGSILKCTGIGGNFRSPDAPGNYDYLFLAAGSGITPIYSLIKTLLITTNSSILLCYSNQSKSLTMFYEEILALTNQYPDRFRVQFYFSDHEKILERRLSTERLRHVLKENYTGKQDQTMVYVCGPFMYMDSAQIVLKSFGFAESHIKMEDFNPISPTEIELPPDTDKHLVTIHMNGRTHEIEVQFPYSIVTVAKEEGIPVPSSCESGQCGTCKARLLQGEIWMAYNEVLTPRDLERGYRLTCNGFPLNGDVEIIYD